MAYRLSRLAACLIAPAVGVLAFVSPLTWPTELSTVEARFELRGKSPPPPGVLLVALDRPSAKRLGAAPGGDPDPAVVRGAFGETLERLSQTEARALVLVGPFSSVDPEKSKADRKLIDGVSAGGKRVVVGVFCPDSEGAPGEIGAFTRAGARTGSLCINAFDKVRQVPLQVLDQRGLAVEAARAANVPVPESAFRREPGYDSTVKWAWINWAGARDSIKSVSLTDVNAELSAAELRGLADGRVVVIEYNGSGSASEPFFDSPAPGRDGTVYSGDVYGNAMATMVEGFPLRETPRWLSILIICLCGIAGPAAALRVRPSRWALMIGLLLVGSLIALQLAFNAGWILPAVAIVAAILASIPAAMLISYLGTRSELGEIRRRFAGADPEAVDAVLKGTVVSGAAVSEAIVPGYRIEAEIGRGGSGNVYRATNVRTGEPVALKVIKPLLASDEKVRVQFEREIKAAARLDHPCVVPILDGGESDGLLFTVTPYIQSGDLQAAIDDGSLLESNELLGLARDVGGALDAAHKAGLVHRDVKPANVFRTVAGFRIADFGVARIAGEETISASQGTVGTIAYAAPEQLGEPGEIGPATDLYGLASTLVAAACGEPPFGRESISETLAAKAGGGDPSLGDLSEAVQQVLARALSPSPADRQQTGSEFAEQLRQAWETGS